MSNNNYGAAISRIMGSYGKPQRSVQTTTVSEGGNFMQRLLEVLPDILYQYILMEKLGLFSGSKKQTTLEKNPYLNLGFESMVGGETGGDWATQGNNLTGEDIQNLLKGFTLAE